MLGVAHETVILDQRVYDIDDNEVAELVKEAKQCLAQGERVQEDLLENIRYFDTEIRRPAIAERNEYNALMDALRSHPTGHAPADIREKVVR